MHTHFGSATFTAASFTSVLLFGSFWKLGWLNVLAWGTKTGNKHAIGFAKAALFQYN